MLAGSRVVRGRRLCAGLGVFALLLLAAVPAAGQEAPAPADELGLEATVGYGGRVVSSARTPVEVTVEPARLLQAELAVVTRTSGGVVREVRDIEVAARTRQVYRFLVPTGPVAITITEPGREPTEARARSADRERGFLVGVLGTVPEGAPALRSEPTGITGTWVPVDPAWLGVGVTALEPLAGLVADAAALAEMSAEQRRNLAAGVVAGTDLLIVGDTTGLTDLGLPLPAEVAGADPATRTVTPAPGARTVPAGQLLPAEEDIAADEVLAAYRPAGAGSVIVVSHGPGEGAVGRAGAVWSLLVSPSGRQQANHGEWAVDRTPYQFARMFTDSGGSVPALPWLALFTAAYVLVVGPVNGFVLARLGRRELAWVTVPMVTVVFTTGAFLGVTGGRPPVGLAGRVLMVVDGVASEMVAVAVRAPTAGERTLEVQGEGWSAALLSEAGRQADLRPAGGLAASLDLSALQFGGLVASRSTTAGPPLDLEATATPEGVRARVRNTGGTPIEGVVVRAATAARSVGTLAPGEEQEIEIVGTSLPTASPYRDPFDGLGTGPPRAFEALVRDRIVDGRPGLVWAIGTLASGTTGVRVDGVDATDRGQLLLAGVTPDSTGPPGPFVVRRDVMSSDRDVFRPSPLALENANEAFLRFQLPADADPATLRQRLDAPPDGMRREVTVWSPGTREWRPLAEAFGEDGGDPAALLDPLGVLWVRIQGDLYPLDHSGMSVDGLGEVR